MHNIIVVHVCLMNFFYVFIVPGPILRHLGEFGKIRLLLGENTRFLPEEGQYGYLKDGLWPIFNFFFFLCRIWLHLILAWSRPMKLNISGDIWILSDFRHLAWNRNNSKMAQNYFMRFLALNSPSNSLKLLLITF